MKATWWQRCLAEAIATFALVFVAVGSICADRFSGGELGLLGIALAQAAVLACMIYATAHVSGGHINPAVTIAVAASGGIAPMMALAYIVSQLTGAALGAAAMATLFTPELWRPVALGTPLLSPEVAFSTGVFVEAVLSFFLVFAVFQVAFDRRAPAMVYGLAIGLVVFAGTLVGGPLTGAAMNPARAFGPALASGTWNGQLVYWLGPIAGALAAAFAYRLLQPRRTQ